MAFVDKTNGAEKSQNAKRTQVTPVLPPQKGPTGTVKLARHRLVRSGSQRALAARMPANLHCVQLIVLVGITLWCSITAEIFKDQSSVTMSPITAKSTSTGSPKQLFIETTGCGTIEHRITGQVFTPETGCAITNLVKCGRACDIVLILLSLATTPDEFVQDANKTLNATAFTQWHEGYQAGKLTGNYYFISDKFDDYDYIRYYLYDRAFLQSQLDWLEARLPVLTQIRLSQSESGYEVALASILQWSVEGSLLAGMAQREMVRRGTSEGLIVFTLQENGVAGQYVIDGEIPNYVVLRWGQDLVSSGLLTMVWESVHGMTVACAETNADLEDIQLRELVAEHHWNSDYILGAKQICRKGWTLGVSHELDYNSLPFSGFGLPPVWPLPSFNISFYDGQDHDYLSRIPVGALNDRFTYDKVIINDRAHKAFNAIVNFTTVELPPYHSYVVMSNSSYGSASHSMMYVVEYETCSVFMPVLQEFLNLIAFVSTYGLSSLNVSYSFVFDHRTSVAIQGVELAFQIWYYYNGKYELYSMTGMGSLGSMRFVALCVLSSLTSARLALHCFAGQASNWTLRTVIYTLMILNVFQFRSKDPAYNVVFSISLSALAVLMSIVVGILNRRQRINNCVCNEFRNLARLIPGRFDDTFRVQDNVSFISGRQLALRGMLCSHDYKALFPCECVYLASIANLTRLVGLRINYLRFYQVNVRVEGNHAHGLRYAMPERLQVPDPETLIGGVQCNEDRKRKWIRSHNHEDLNCCPLPRIAASSFGRRSTSAPLGRNGFHSLSHWREDRRHLRCKFGPKSWIVCCRDGRCARVARSRTRSGVTKFRSNATRPTRTLRQLGASSPLTPNGLDL